MTLAIVAAMQDELSTLLDDMGRSAQRSVHGRREFFRGELWGTPCVAVLSRIGKVAAAATVTTLIHEFAVERIVFTGVAGGIGAGLRVGDVVVANELVQHDFDASPIFPRHEIPLLGMTRFATDPALTYTAAPALLAGDAFTGTLSRAAGDDAGSYAIGRGSLTAGPNYDVTFVAGTFAIGRKTLTITADAKAKTYGETDPVLTYASAGLVAPDTIAGSLSRIAGEAAPLLVDGLPLGRRVARDPIESSPPLRHRSDRVAFDQIDAILFRRGRSVIMCEVAVGPLPLAALLLARHSKVPNDRDVVRLLITERALLPLVKLRLARDERLAAAWEEQNWHLFAVDQLALFARLPSPRLADLESYLGETPPERGRGAQLRIPSAGWSGAPQTPADPVS